MGRGHLLSHPLPLLQVNSEEAGGSGWTSAGSAAVAMQSSRKEGIVVLRTLAVEGDQ